MSEALAMPAAPAGHLHRLEHVMGMPIAVDVCDAHVPATSLDRVFDWLRFVDSTFSTYRPQSEISRINRGELALARAHPAVRSVLARCERMRRETDGYFDANAPLAGAHRNAGAVRQLDPSGLVKGWSIAGAARLLRDAGARNFCIDAAGDIYAAGRPPHSESWRVGIRHPLLRDQIAAAVAVSDAAVATSGAYERGAHIVDPHSGQPPAGVLSVTVVGPDVTRADVYATAAFAMGPAGAHWCAGLPDYSAMVILSDQTVRFTAAFLRHRL